MSAQEDAVVEAVVAFLAKYDRCEDAMQARFPSSRTSPHRIQRPDLRERIGGPPRNYVVGRWSDTAPRGVERITP